MRMLVVGAGSTGGYFGSRLAAAGKDVTFLVRPARAEQLRRNGLQIVSPAGDLLINPKLLAAGEISAPFDIVLLTVKAFSLAATVEDFAPAVGPNTVILPVLNGMKHMDVLSARFGAERLAGCVCKIATVLDQEGRITHLAPFHDLFYGERDGALSDRMAAIDAFMKGAGFDARLSSSIEREMWEKWILLASLGAINCLMRGTVGDIAAAPGGAEFAASLLDEAVATVHAAGTAPSDAFVAAAKDQLTRQGSTQTSSMYRDLKQGKRIEAEQIVGDLVRRAREAQVATPLLSAAFANLSIYQSGLAAE
ncbi:2-dehydropantoate 2-reductase [Rhizobium sp. Root483D2]|uniref:2-dehydropantoate 2-reductase n=1 Tax=Rhizobium sp. Root483D2 TaxID=1736545 RepID=UPI0007148684|nr:2-dehydropantoate 2-reductase [Rhizobium sp. Root483D2]KQY21003.1 2-dehydropantoate 2-reductase [Rhizobium sp. Root483D2]